jgi:membrane-associated phospholipid phosphatase
MRPAPSQPTVRRALAFGAVAFLILSGLAFTVRTPLYESLAGAAFQASGLHGIVAFTAGKGLLVLLAVTALVAVAAWRRGREAFVLLLAAGVGTVAAYGASEAVKVLVTEERPCRAVAIDTIMACPAAGDWSWPSNHATIAAALAASCVLVFPRLWPLVAPLALLIAFSRVLVGVHYLHDVAAGLALGIALTLVASSLAGRHLTRILASRAALEQR